MQGHLPPLFLRHDAIQGFYVEAACDLPELTLIAEYLGQVRTCAQTINDTNDSIMELLCCSGQDGAEDLDRSLVIVPYKYANAARYFNGINNSKKDSKRKI